MFKVFKREIKANLKAMLIWAAAVLALSVVGFGEYGVVMEGGIDLGGVMALMPQIVKSILGMGVISVDTPEGWYACMFVWCAIAAYIHAALLGAGILSKEESDKTAEFLYTKPITREKVIRGKTLAAFVSIFVVVFACWGGAYALMYRYVHGTSLELAIHLTMLGMLLTSMVFFSIGLLLSAIFKGRGKAAQYAVIVVFAFYLISVVIEVSGDIDYLRVITPFRYFDAATILNGGYDYLYNVLSVAILGVAGALTEYLYKRRDLHS